LYVIAAGFNALLAVNIIYFETSSHMITRVVMSDFVKYMRFALWMSSVTLVLKANGDFHKIDHQAYDIIVLVASILTVVFLILSYLL
jgi:hypothetical protein